MEFSQALLGKTLNSSTDIALDEANFGIIKLSINGDIEFYNKFESELSGLSKEKVLNKNFFTQIAPCTNNYMVSHKFLTSVEENVTMDETIEYMFTYKLKPTNITLRLLHVDNTLWLCVNKK